MLRRQLPALGVALLTLTIGMLGPAWGAAAGSSTRAEPRGVPELPTPGTAREVAALVKAAPRIGSLPAVTVPPLTEAAANRPGLYYPATLHGCLRPTTCVYGDTRATRTIVLFGDSHAVMWLPALDPIGTALGYRVVLFYKSACPPVKVTIYLAPGQDGPNVGYYRWCDVRRWLEIREIRAMRPALVLLASKTFWDYSSPNRFFTAQQWEQGLQWTVDRLRTNETKVAVIGDITYMSMSLPECLAAYPSRIQTCGGPSPNPDGHGNQAAEQAEAAALGIPYIRTNQWICSSWCSPVVGDMIVSLDQSHINAVYAEFLTDVMKAAIERVLAAPAS